MRITLKTLKMMLLSVLTVTVLRMLVTLMLLNVLAATFAQGSPTPVKLADIVERMERAQSAVSIPNHMIRDYRLGRQDSASVDSYGIAEVDFRPPGKYTVTKRSGSRRAFRIGVFVKSKNSARNLLPAPIPSAHGQLQCTSSRVWQKTCERTVEI